MVLTGPPVTASSISEAFRVLYLGGLSVLANDSLADILFSLSDNIKLAFPGVGRTAYLLQRASSHNKYILTLSFCSPPLVAEDGKERERR